MSFSWDLEAPSLNTSSANPFCPASEEESFDLITNQMLILMMLMFIATSYYANRARRFDYDSWFARGLEGVFQLLLHWHTSPSTKLQIADGDLMALGPHELGFVDAAATAAHVSPGRPLHFLGTQAFDRIPGVRAFYRCFEVISVPVSAKRSDIEKTQRILEASNFAAKALLQFHQDKLPDCDSKSKQLQIANDAVKALQTMVDQMEAKQEAEVVKATTNDLKVGGRVVVFPTGNFWRIGEPSPRVYDGTAKAAIAAGSKINVVHLSGFWALSNPLIPVFIKNSALYRAFFSALHMNNIQPRLCLVLDDHLKPENAGISEEELIRILNAKMYAVFRRKTMTDDDFAEVQTEISSGKYLEIWDRKLALDMMKRFTTSYARELADMERTIVQTVVEEIQADADAREVETTPPASKVAL